MADLLAPLVMGDVTLKNRVIMAPLTRMRAKLPGFSPYELTAEYYSQRAGAGLIISEASQISQQGQGYPATPGIYSEEQIAGWKLVTDAVHNAGGTMFMQLWHVGRVSHTSHQPDGALPVAPSAIAPARSAIIAADWESVTIETPRALEQSEIPGIVEDYRKAAENAKKAGFKGVEVHGANGYLPDEFLQDGSNQRTDEYGGSIENRARLLLEIVDAVVGVWGKGRVGVRLSPYGTVHGMSDSNPVELFSYVLEQLNAREIAYVHLIEPRATKAGRNDTINEEAPSTSEIFRDKFNGVFISAGGYLPDTAKAAVESGSVDAVAFGRYFISNPDLPKRIEKGIELTPYDRPTFYGGTEKGYTDYPFAE
ncbi:MAG: alkene reductase [Methyloligellaceae bacterium]